nr:hypothetical protein [Variovorax sp. CAN15]
MPMLVTPTAQHIQAGDLKPEVIITHHMALEDAARGYDIFEKAEEDCRKVVLTPSGPQPAARPAALEADRALPL